MDLKTLEWHEARLRKERSSLLLHTRTLNGYRNDLHKINSGRGWFARTFLNESSRADGLRNMIQLQSKLVSRLEQDVAELESDVVAMRSAASALRLKIDPDDPHDALKSLEPRNFELRGWLDDDRGKETLDKYMGDLFNTYFQAAQEKFRETEEQIDAISRRVEFVRQDECIRHLEERFEHLSSRVGVLWEDSGREFDDDD